MSCQRAPWIPAALGIFNLKIPYLMISQKCETINGYFSPHMICVIIYWKTMRNIIFSTNLKKTCGKNVRKAQLANCPVRAIFWTQKNFQPLKPTRPTLWILEKTVSSEALKLASALGRFQVSSVLINRFTRFYSTSLAAYRST